MTYLTTTKRPELRCFCGNAPGAFCRGILCPGGRGIAPSRVQGKGDSRLVPGTKIIAFDRPDEGTGYRIDKAQKKAFDEIKGLRAKGLERRADNLPPADQRRMARVFSANDRFENSFGEGAPLRSTPFSNDEFQAAAQTRFGVKLICLTSSTSLRLKSNACAIDKFVDTFGSNFKKLVGAEGGGTTANHNSFMNAISAWCRRAQIPQRGGTSGTPRIARACSPYTPRRSATATSPRRAFGC